MKDFIDEIDYFGLSARIKRLSDTLNSEARNLYAYLGFEIEPNWHLIFLSLKDESLSVTEIAKQLKFSHPAVVKIIKKMKDAGYVESVQDKNDARKQILSLTNKSKTLLPKFEHSWNKIQLALRECSNEKFLDHIKFFEDNLKKASLVERIQTMSEDKFPRIQQVNIIKYDNKYKVDFARLNFEWLNKYFYVEEYDKKVLNNPEQYIIKGGGIILFAIVNNKVVGTLALINRKDEGFELSKMAVTEEFRGLKIGQKLMDKTIKIALDMGIKKLILESNTTLEAAIKLYKKVGFKKIPLDEKSPYHRSNIKMELDLTNRKTT